MAISGPGSSSLTDISNNALTATAVGVTTSGSTTGNYTNATNPTFYAPGNQSLTFTDAMAAGSTSTISEYDTRLTCTNAFTGTGATSNASLPNNQSTTTATFTPAPGDDITCTYTNTPKPRITFQKAIAATGGGRVSATDQFALTNGGTTGTTTGTGSTVSSSALLYIGTAGTAMTLSEAAAGTTDLANYTGSISCTNSTAGSATVLPNGTGTSFSLTPANRDVISCTLTNTRKSATLTLRKTWSQATVNDAVNVSATGVNSRTFASVANTVSETDTDATTVTVYAGETVGLAEAFTTGLSARYNKALACTGNGALTYTANTLSGSLVVSNLDNAITCTFTNTRLPTLTVRKISNGDVGSFVFPAGTNGYPGETITTATSGTAVSGTLVPLAAAATSTAISETVPAGYLLTAASCTGMGAGGTATLVGNTLTLDAAATASGSNIVCTFTNTKMPTLILRKTSNGGLGTFGFALGNTIQATGSITTTSAGVAQQVDGDSVTAGTQAYTVAATGTAVTINENSLPSGWSLAGATCTNSGGTTVGSLAGTTYTIPSGNVTSGEVFTCTFFNNKVPTVRVQKVTTGGVGGPFSFAQTNLSATLSSITTVTAGVAAPVSPTAVTVTTTGADVTLTETPASGFELSTAACTDANSAVTGNTGSFGSLASNVLTIPATRIVNGADITCVFTNRKTAQLTLRKSWTNAIVNNAVSITSTGGTANPSLASTANTATETDVATAVTVYAGETLTFSESFTTGSSANYTSTLTCTGAADSNPSDGLTVNAADTAITCTYANVRKSANLTLQKTWVNAKLNDAVNVTATGLTTLASTANTASETDAAAVQTVYAGDVITLGESFTTGSAANYTSSLACTGTTGLSGNTLTVGATDTPITCTQTNSRIAKSVTLRKSWVNAKLNDAVSVTATGLTSLSAVADTATEIDAGSAQTVYAGDVITLGESFTTGSASNYTSSLACTGTTGLSGNILTVGATDTPITCTQTNSRIAKSVTLQKTWVNAKVNDAVNVTATGLTTLASTANTASETDAGSAQTVYAGDVITLGESFTTGSAANYTSSLACTGTTGLSGNALTVGATDTPITCTQTNSRKSVNLTLRKTWVNAKLNDAVSVTATGLTSLASVANTANETDAGVVQTVYAGEAITLGETFTTGSAANYTASLTCTGNATALAGSVLTV
ncbi:prealbumin-like fold domain-containing protein, partial [Fluviicoccus keumensis]|uniref:beta strand repeat-containing protein n=1 Tax=Fluviicoccus keumensis TaxID=1435465 RepID=UPI0030FE1B00